MAQVPIAGPDGIVWVDENSLTADELSLDGQHWNAIHRYLGNGDSGALDGFEGITIGGVPLLTDADQIDQLAEDDRLDFEQFYENR